MTSGSNGAAPAGPPLHHEMASVSALPTTLIASKLTMPPAHSRAVRRPRIETRLTRGVDGPLTLVAAPAGYGKTTSVASWAAASQAPVAWVSLDVQDNNPVRFWTYLVAALARAGAAVSSSPDGDSDPVALANTLAALDHDIVLVLDDVHLVTNPNLHRDLTFLVEQRLPGLHLVLLCRFDPPFIRPRWKANGDVVEIRARDLAFTDEESLEFLDDQHVRVEPAVRGRLLAKVHGWAAALRLLTVWMAGRDDTETALAQFAAGDTTITDYLVAEVLTQLPADTREFLLRTSILSRLTGPLCDALTDASPDGTAAADVLADLQRQDLFVQALDPEHQVFRYHPLFSELLRLELQRTASDLVPELHRRASQWFAAHGFAEEAIDHGILAQDWSSVRSLLLAETLAIGVRYHHSVVADWLAALPADVVAGSAFFLVMQGYVQATFGDTTVARRTLARVHGAAGTGQLEFDLPELIAVAHAVEAGIARLEADLPATRTSHAATVHELARLSDPQGGLAPMARAIADVALGGALFWDGDPGATALIARTEATAADRGLERMRVNAQCSRVLVLATSGRLREAADLSQHALGAAVAIGVSTAFQATPVHLALAVITAYRGDTDAALGHAAEVTERGLRHGDRGPVLAAAVLTARLLGERGDAVGAFTALDHATAAWPEWVAPPPLHAVTLAEHARLSIMTGDLGAARAVAAQLDSLLPSPRVTTASQLTRARVLHAEGDHLGSATRFAAVAGGRRSLLTHVEAEVATAASCLAAGRPTDAVTHLVGAMTAARPEQIVAPFLWQRSAVRTLLMKIESGAADFAGTAFKQHLLDALGLPVVPTTRRASPPLPDPLSDRELVVLRMLRTALTAAEIASSLSISPNTLKTHVKNINRKLGTDNRRQALARADELALL